MPLYYYDIRTCFYAPLLSLQLSSKKKQLFFIHFAFSYPFQKSVVLCDDCLYRQCRKKEKTHRQRYGLTCILKNDNKRRMNGVCHRRRNRRKKLV